MNISLEYRLSQKEFSESLMISYKVFGFRRAYFYFSIIVVIGCFLAALLFLIVGIKNMDFPLVFPSIYLGWLGFILMPQSQTKLFIQRLFKQYPFLGETVHQVSINNNSFTYSKSEHNWQTIKGVAESDAIFIVMHLTNIYYVLPKKAFPDEQTLDLFRTVLRNNEIKVFH
ncbi:MAG: YcxB family protein [Chroococcales cyanobacterium]